MTLTTSTTVLEDAQRLLGVLNEHRRVVVAFSGGVDSSVVAAAAAKANRCEAIAVTADSPSVPRWQLQLARRVADEIGIEHRVLATTEVQRNDYRANDARRCFFCKQTLYAALHQFVASQEVRGEACWIIVSGTNADDLGDYRPGIEAGYQAKVETPLAELGFGKAEVRRLAQYFGLSNHDLPASPCLSSRIAYGVEVTPERLRRVEQAENWLRERGYHELRVRLHAGELARIEVPPARIPAVVAMDAQGELTAAFVRFGFQFVTIDLQGLRSGSMNRDLVSLDLPPKFANSSAEPQEASR